MLSLCNGADGNNCGNVFFIVNRVGPFWPLAVSIVFLPARSDNDIVFESIKLHIRTLSIRCFRIYFNIECVESSEHVI